MVPHHVAVWWDAMEGAHAWVCGWIEFPQEGITAGIFDEEIYSHMGCTRSPQIPSIFL